MDTYKVVFKADNTEAVYGISLVKSPAMESAFLALSAQANTFQLKAIDNERRILLGAVLIPDKPVYRKQDGKEFNITFPPETILLASQNFLKQGYQKNSTIEHDEKQVIENVTFVESWIKEDATHDKSVAHGFDEPIGTWFATMKVDNDEIWTDYIKTGKVTGFSIDGFFDLEKINLSAEELPELNLINMSKEKEDSFIEKLVKGIQLAFQGKALDLGKVKTEDEAVEIHFEGDTLAQDAEVWLMGPEEEKMPVPDGEYKLFDGEKKITIKVVNSIVSELKATEEEVIEEEVPLSEEPAKQAVKSEEFTQKVFYQLASEMGKQMAKMEQRLETKLTANQEATIIALTKVKPEVEKPWSEMSALEKRRASKTN